MWECELDLTLSKWAKLVIFVVNVVELQVPQQQGIFPWVNSYVLNTLEKNNHICCSGRKMRIGRFTDIYFLALL
jgi:hypothetical protein